MLVKMGKMYFMRLRRAFIYINTREIFKVLEQVSRFVSLCTYQPQELGALRYESHAMVEDKWSIHRSTTYYTHWCVHSWSRDMSWSHERIRVYITCSGLWVWRYSNVVFERCSTFFNAGNTLLNWSLRPYVGSSV